MEGRGTALNPGCTPRSSTTSTTSRAGWALLSSERRTAARAQPYTRDFYCLPATVCHQMMKHMAQQQAAQQQAERPRGGRLASFCERIWACVGRS